MVPSCGAALRLGLAASQWADTHRIAFGRGTFRASSMRNRRAGTSSKGSGGAPCETNRTGMRSDMMNLFPSFDDVHRAQGDMSLAADDDVVVQADPDRLQRIAHFAGQRDIIA